MIRSSQRSGQTFRAACIQLNAGSDLHKNFSLLERLVRQAIRVRPDVIALPENFLWRGGSEHLADIAGLTGEVLERFKREAKSEKVAFMLGGLVEPSKLPHKFYNTAFWIASSGQVTAAYRKMHLFDIDLSPGLKIQESAHILKGRNPVVVTDKKIVSGLSICYDLRFPELYRSMSSAGAQVLFVPANFTKETGRAHWEVLLRARAIENQCFVVAPAQVGKNPSNGVVSYGHSLIVDPWGSILREGSSAASEVLWADLDIAQLKKVRRSLPALRHRVLKS